MRRRDVAGFIFMFGISLLMCSTTSGQSHAILSKKQSFGAVDNREAIKNRKLITIPKAIPNQVVYNFSNPVTEGCSQPNTFQATYTQGLDDHIMDFVESTDGNFMLAGQSTGPNAFGRKEAIILKIDSRGNFIFNNRISSDKVNSFNRIINTADGGYAAVGNTGAAVYLVKISSTGGVTWSASFNNNELNGYHGIDLVETKDGGLAVIANYGESYDAPYIVIFKTNEVGNLQWSEKFISAKKAIATAITIVRDSLYISGYCSENYTLPSDGILIKINALTGQHYWTKSYDKAGMIDQASSVDYSRGTLTLGFSHNNEVTYPFEKSFTRVDLNGNVLLSKKINTSIRNYVQRFLSPVADGGFIVATGNTYDYVPNAGIARFDSAGNPVFSKEYPKAGWQFMSGVKQLSDGTFAMAGDNAPFFNYQDNAELIKTDAYGNTGDCDADSMQITTSDEILKVSSYSWTSIQSAVFPNSQFVTSKETRDNIIQNIFCRSLPCDSAAISPCLETFEKLYGGNGDDMAYDSHATNDNGYIVAGETTSGISSGKDGFLMKVKKNGAISWSKTIGGMNEDVLSKVTQTQDGFTAIGTTRSFGNTNGETFIVHTDALGNLLWSKHYSAGGVLGEKGKNIIQLTDGGYAFVSNVNDSTSLGDGLIARIDATGNIIWSKRFDNGNDDGFTTLLEDGNQLVVGGYASFLNRDAVLVKLNMIDGSVLSSRSYYNYVYQDDEMVNVEKINNGIAYSFWSRHKDNTYYLNYISCFKERNDETIFYQRKGGVSQENRLLSMASITTPDSSFVYADCDTSVTGFGEMIKIGPTGLGNEWGRDYPYGQHLMSLDRISNRGLLSAGFEKSYSTSNKNKIMLIATDFVGRSGECDQSLGKDFVDTAHYIISPFQWKNITSNAIIISTPVSPQCINSNFATNTICSATVCDSIPPISDSCTTGTVIKYKSYYTNFLTGIIKASDGNNYISGEHSYDMSLEPLIVKTKPNGEVVWAKTYNQDMRSATFIKILATSDNKIIVAGENNLTINHGSADSVSIIKLDYNGDIIWAKNFSRGGYSSNVNDIIASNDGGFFMVITEGYGSGGTYTVVTKINANGDNVWRKEIRSYANSPIFRAITFDGKNLFFAADTYNINGFLTIVKLDATTGNYKWSKAVSLNNMPTIIRSIETIGDTVFVFYTLNTPTGTFTSINNLIMLKLSAVNGNMLDNIKLDKPLFANEYLFSGVYNYHMPHELIKTSDNNFIFTNQADNSGKKSLNMVCFNSSGKVQWLRDYPNMTSTGVFTLIQSENELLLVSQEKKIPADVYESSYTGGLIKTDLKGNIKSAVDPLATCYSTLIPNNVFTTYPYQEIPTRVVDVIDAPDLKSSLYKPYNRDIYFKAVQECNEISNCNFLSISGKDSICNNSDTITYKIIRNIGCTSPAVWQADTTFLKIVDISDTTLQVIFLRAGNTNIAAKISSGCSIITKSFPVISLVSPDKLNLGSDKDICIDTSIILNAGEGFKSYFWQDGSAGSTFEVKAPGTYYVKATSFCGVVLTDSVIISKAVYLPLFIGNDTTICKNDSLVLNANPGFSSYNWSPSYHISTITGRNVVVSPAKDTAYFVSAIQPNGCIVTDTIQVSLYSVQPLSLGNDTSICSGTNLLLDAGAGFKKYHWSTGASTQQIIASDIGQYYVAATDNNSCSSKDTLQILNVFTLPVVHLGNDTSLCQGEVLPLNAGAGFNSYLWNTGALIQNIVASKAGIYIVNVVDKNKCRGSDSLSIISILPAASISLGNDTMICRGDKILLDAGPGFINYQWNTGETTQQIFITQQGSFFVAAKNINNCISRDSFSLLRVNDLPVINLDKNESICSGITRTLDAGAGVSYIWQDGSTKSTFIASGLGKYWVRVTSSTGCEASDTTEIRNILPSPANFIKRDTAICQGLDLTLMPQSKFVNYLWSTGRTSSSINITTSGKYWLQVTDANGCIAKEYINVVSKDCVSALYFPNAFTPNNDGHNDVYKPTLYGAIVNFHIIIYNRFGEKVYESYDINRGWDGSFKNVKQNNGVFTWHSEYQLKNGPWENQKGIITLIK